MGRAKGTPNKRHIPKVDLNCPTCGRLFFIYPSQKRRLDRKQCVPHCSRDCADKDKKNHWKTFGPSTGNWKDGNSSYRQKAIRHYGMICQKCGYDGTKYPKLIWVHHRNFKSRKDQDNHDLSNLEVLCIRCHLEKHYDIENNASTTPSTINERSQYATQERQIKGSVLIERKQTDTRGIPSCPSLGYLVFDSTKGSTLAQIQEVQNAQ